MFRHGVVDVMLLLCVTQVVLLQAEVHVHLVQLVAETVHRRAQMLILPERLLKFGM
jgi:hypothetical protein